MKTTVIVNLYFAQIMKTTSAPLKAAFKPVVHDAVEKVKLTTYWEPVAGGYNKVAKFTGKEEVNTDLDEYVTDKGMSGLFTLVKAEERKIRKDPVAQVTDLLKKVFVQGLTETCTRIQLDKN